MTGKQLQIVMSYEDENIFQSFLKQNTDLVFIESFAARSEGLFKEKIEKEFVNHSMYYIWNKKFAWVPEYKQVGTNVDTKEMIGRYYVANTSGAPLIEFSRSNMIDISKILDGRYGRIYWAKTFATPKDLNYDVELFDQWYIKVARWIKKNSSGKIDIGGINVWFLPKAWEMYKNRKS